MFWSLESEWSFDPDLQHAAELRLELCVLSFASQHKGKQTVPGSALQMRGILAAQLSLSSAWKRRLYPNESRYGHG